MNLSTVVTRHGPHLVLLLHGLGCAKESFDGLRDLDGVTTCALDLPGHGASERLPDYSLEAHARAAAEVVDSFAPARLTVVGHSMGGAVGLLLSRERRVDRFVGVEGNLVAGDCGRLSRKVADADLDDYLRRGHRAFERGLRGFAGPEPAAWFAKAAPEAVHGSARSLVAWSDGGGLLTIFRGLDSTYVHGADSDLGHVLPLLADTVAIPGSGHFPMVDNPTRFREVVQRSASATS